ncbi:conjugal transfer protein [Streptococcus entericus]|uniref:hypothetical protein n=1 Tax=Streptococcus entericus TaxID=155680 RepID=UPI0003624745|nr:hypothetical protein [Streptococcus entericus]
MAKIGLDFGEKVEIGGKSYRGLSQAIDVAAALGELRFGKIEGDEIVYEEQVENGRTVSVNTGEIRGVTISATSMTQEGTVFILLTEMTKNDVESLGLKHREPVSLEHLDMTYSSIDGRDIYNLFATRVMKKATNQPGQNHQKPDEKSDKPNK